MRFIPTWGVPYGTDFDWLRDGTPPDADKLTVDLDAMEAAIDANDPGTEDITFERGRRIAYDTSGGRGDMATNKQKILADTSGAYDNFTLFTGVPSSCSSETVPNFQLVTLDRRGSAWGARYLRIQLNLGLVKGGATPVNGTTARSSYLILDGGQAPGNGESAYKGHSLFKGFTIPTSIAYISQEVFIKNVNNSFQWQVGDQVVPTAPGWMMAIVSGVDY